MWAPSGNHAGNLADVGRRLDEPLAGAVRVDHVDLRIAEVWIEPRERDLAVRAAWGRRRRNRCRRGERDREQRDKNGPDR